MPRKENQWSVWKLPIGVVVALAIQKWVIWRHHWVYCWSLQCAIKRKNPLYAPFVILKWPCLIQERKKTDTLQCFREFANRKNGKSTKKRVVSHLIFDYLYFVCLFVCYIFGSLIPTKLTWNSNFFAYFNNDECLFQSQNRSVFKSHYDLTPGETTSTFASTFARFYWAMLTAGAGNRFQHINNI